MAEPSELRADQILTVGRIAQNSLQSLILSSRYMDYRDVRINWKMPGYRGCYTQKRKKERKKVLLQVLYQLLLYQSHLKHGVAISPAVV